MRLRIPALLGTSAALALLHGGGLPPSALALLFALSALSAMSFPTAGRPIALLQLLGAGLGMLVLFLGGMQAMQRVRPISLALAGLLIIGLPGWAALGLNALRRLRKPRSPPADPIQLGSRLASGQRLGWTDRLRVAGPVWLSLALFLGPAALLLGLSALFLGPGSLMLAGLCGSGAAAATRRVRSQWRARVPRSALPRDPLDRPLRVLIALGLCLALACAPLLLGVGPASLAASALLLCIGLLALALSDRHRQEAAPRHVLAREGLVEFQPEGTLLYRWEHIASARSLDTPTRIAVRLTNPPLPADTTLHIPPPRGTLWLQRRQLHYRHCRTRYGAELVIELHHTHGGEDPIDRIRRALGDRMARRQLPTFTAPDGPPEAVLAPLRRLE